MGVHAIFHFSLSPAQDCCEFVRHLDLVAHLAALPHLNFQQLKVYRGSVWEPDTFLTLNNLDDTIQLNFKSFDDADLSRLVFVSEFGARRICKGRFDAAANQFELEEAPILTELVTAGRQSSIFRPFDRLNSWWDAGNEKRYDPLMPQPTWLENKDFLMSELRLIADKADGSEIIGAGRNWPDDPDDIYLMVLSKMQYEPLNVLRLADETDAEIHELDRAMIVHSPSFVSGRIRALYRQLTTTAKR